MAGNFVNPGNEAFFTAIRSKIYVDKTGLIAYTNSVLNSKDAWICNSRPRRFGKSTTADMLAAYYSRGCDSSELFSCRAISHSSDYKDHLNRHNVIYFDVQSFYLQSKDKARVVSEIEMTLLEELRSEFASILNDKEDSLTKALSDIQLKTRQKFIIIIDEWDHLIREELVPATVRRSYIEFLSSLFKGTGPSKYIELAYLTGILPIIKIRMESALNNFTEFTMLGAGPLTPYIGFTEEEVKQLCHTHETAFSEVKRWYDGYRLNGLHLYNPRAVAQLVTLRQFQSYWSQTGTFRTIRPYLDMNFTGLKDCILTMLAGESVSVSVNQFQNDLDNFSGRDDVLTFLIHLGYLAYDADSQTVTIPNEEIREEFRLAVAVSNPWQDIIGVLQRSQQMLNALFANDSEAVAEAVDYFHDNYVSVLQYNDENSLTCVLSVAFLSAMRWYYKPVREMPAGKGFADLVFIPKASFFHTHPALVVELKWNQSADSAIRQIQNRRYFDALEGCADSALLVGINYDRLTKKHECRIENLTL